MLSASDREWDFVMSVNLRGIAHFIRNFVPGMLKQNAPGSIVTTASQDGLCAAQGVYGVSKHAAVALTEALHGEVRGRLSVHTLCPNVVATNIPSSERARPARFGSAKVSSNPKAVQASQEIQNRFTEFGMRPSRCAEYVFAAIRSGTFYILVSWN